MGIFDIFKKRNSESKGSQEPATLNQFERDLIQVVALTMFQLKITKQPALSFFKNDQGIFEGIFTSHTTDPQMLEIAQSDFDTYLMVMGCHALGAAAYVAVSQGRYQKPVDQFGETEMVEISQTLFDTDAYEAGLNALGFKLDGNNKQCLDHIVLTANNAAQKLAGQKMHDKNYQKVYMKVLYNAGVTLIHGR